MMIVTLEEAKSHLEVDFSDKDAQITMYTKMASKAVATYIKSGTGTFQDSNGDLIEDSNGIAIDVPEDIRFATLMMLGFMYKNRDNNDDGAYDRGYLPKPVTALLYPYRSPGYA